VNVVDSFAFVEYFRNGPNAKVFKKFRVELDLEAAEEAVSHTQPLN
jgi:hypothetical protein